MSGLGYIAVRVFNAGTLDGLKALEDEAIAAHKRVAEALEGCRLLLHGVIVERYGKIYQITGLRADRGIIRAYGVRVFEKKNNAGSKVGVRDYDLYDFRECKILKYPNSGDATTEHDTTSRLLANPQQTSASVT